MDQDEEYSGSSESEDDSKEGPKRMSRIAFWIQLDGKSVKKKALRPGRAWAILNVSGSISKLAPSLRHKPSLTSSEVVPLLKGGNRLVNVCDSCQKPGHTHSSACTRPRHAISVAPKSGKGKASTPSILKFITNSGARSATKDSNERVASLLKASSASSAATNLGDLSSSSTVQLVPDSTETFSQISSPTTKATAISTSTTTTSTTAASTNQFTPIMQSTNGVHSQSKDSATIKSSKVREQSATASTRGESTIHEELRAEILLGFSHVKLIIETRPNGIFYDFPLDPNREMSAPYQALRTMRFCIVDPALVDEMRRFGYDPKCPRCQRRLERNGYCTASIRLERGRGLYGHIVLGISMVCRGCPGAVGGATSSSFTTLHDEIRAQMPDILRRCFPFVANHNGAVISVQKGFELMRFVESGTSFLAFEEANAESVAAELEEREIDRKMLFRRLNAGKQALSKEYNVTPLTGNTRDYLNAFVLTSKLAIDFYVCEVNRQMPLIQQMFRTACLRGRSLHLDMVHPWGNDGSKEGVIGIWVVLNSYSEIVAVRSAASKSLEDLKGVLLQLKRVCDESNHKLDLFYTDNPSQDEGTLRSVFGETIHVCKDIYHLYANVVDTVLPTSKHRRGWEKVIVNCMWLMVESDVEAEGKRLRSANKSEKEVRRLLKNPHWLRARKSVRHVLRKPVEIADLLMKAMIEYVQLRALGREAVSMIACAIETVKKYLSVPADFVPCVNVGTDDEPHWRYLEGTSMVECFNRLLNRLHLERFSQDVGNAMMCRLAYVFSLTERVNFDRLNRKLRVRDASILNDSAVLEQSFREKGWSNSHIDKPYIPMKPLLDNSLYLSGLHHPVGSIVDKSLDYMVTGSREALPKGVGKRFDPPTKAVNVNFGKRETRPFSRMNRDENALLMAMLGQERFYHKEGKHALFDGTGELCVDKLLSVATRGHFDKLVNFSQLALEWNIRFLVDDGLEISFGAHRVSDSSQIFAKEIVHFKKELTRLAALASANTATDTVRALMFDLSLAPDPLTLQPAPLSVVPQVPLGVVPSMLAPSVPADHVVREASPPPPPVDVSSDGLANSSKSSSRKTGPRSRPTSAKAKRQCRVTQSSSGIPCDECTQLRHGANSLCPVNQWKRRFGKSVPRQGGEDLCDAHRRVWRGVRANFVDPENGGFRLPHPTCDYLGRAS